MMKKTNVYSVGLLALCCVLLVAAGFAPGLASAWGRVAAQTNSCPPHSLLRVDANVSGGTGDGGSWANAYADLQPALLKATECANVTELWVAAGNYVPGADADATFALVNNIALYGGFVGTETAREQRDWESNVTTLNGRYSTSPNRQVQHVVTSNNLNASAVLDGFTIKNGRAISGSGIISQGGGLYNTGGQPTLRNLVFEDNYAYAGGGGLYNTASNLTLTNITFRNNSSRFGGGMLSTTPDALVLLDVVFEGNDATEFSGGGLRMGGVVGTADTATFTNVIFRNNTAEYGGGFYSTAGVHQFANVVFVNNVARRTWDPNVGGGGVLSYDSTLHFVNTTFFGNSAGAAGGGLWAEDSSVTLGNSILWGNTAPDGPQYKLRGTATLAVTYSNVERPSGVQPGTGNLNVNPYFVDAANGNLRLQLGSYCIDSGNNAAVPAGVTTDLEGRPRFVDMPMVPDTGSGTPPIVDMGAYETYLYADVALGKTVTPGSVAPGEAITFTLTLANQGTATATQVVVTDTLTLLTNMSFTSNLVITDTGHTPAYVWAVQDLLPGQSGTITVNGLVALPQAAGARLNIATGTTVNDPYPENNMATASFTVRNVPPAFTSTPITTAYQNTLYAYVMTATDANGDALTFTAPTLPAWLTLTDHGDGTATLAGTPSALGSYNVTLRVSDGPQNVQQAFTIVVGEAPYVDVTLGKAVTPASVAPGEALTFTLTLANQGTGTATQVVVTDTLLWLTDVTFTSNLLITDTGYAPAYVWAVQDLLPGQSGVITITGVVQTPLAAGARLNTATIAAADDTNPNNNTATASFTVLNVAPVFTSVPVTTAMQTVAYSYAVLAADANDDALTFTAPTLPDWLTLTDHGDGTATLAGTPQMSHLGPYAVTLCVADSGGLFAEQSFVITVDEAPYIDVTLSKAVTPDSVAPGEALTFVLTLANQGSGPATQVVVTDTLMLLTGVTFTSDLGITDTGHTPAYVWMVQDLLPGQSGVITVSGMLQSPVGAGAHLNTATIAAADDVDSSNNTATASFTVLNVAPVFTSKPVNAVAQGMLYTYAVAASDANGDTLTFTAPTLPDWLTFTDHGNGTATLAGTPGELHLGQHPVVLRVADSGGLFAEQAFTIRVDETPQPDVALSKAVSSSSVAPGEVLTFTLTLANQGSGPATQVVVTDTLAGLANVTFTSDLVITDTGHAPAYVWAVQDLLPGQSGIIIASGVVQTPKAAGTYTNTAVIAAVDDVEPDNNTATVSFTVRNVAPTFTSMPVNVAVQDVLYSYAVASSDANGDALTFTAPTLPDWLTFTDHGDGTATLSGTPDELHLGEHPVALRVADNGGLFAEQTFTITVFDSLPNVAPVFTSTPINVALQDTLYTYTAIAFDADGDILTFTAPTLPDWLALTDHGNGTATLSGTPGELHLGEHDVVLRVTNASEAYAEQTFTITVQAGSRIYLPLVLRNQP